MNKVSFLIDSKVIEILSSEAMVKTADGKISGLIDTVKQYTENHINPNDKAGSIMRFLGPGLLLTFFKALGLTWLGYLAVFAIKIFNIDIESIGRSIWDKLASLIEGDKKVSSDQIDSIVHSSVSENAPDPSQSDSDNAQKLVSQNSLKNARFIKLMMIQHSNKQLFKNASFFDIFKSSHSKMTSVLSSVLSWIFKVCLASAGLMVAGDIVDKVLGRPNAIDNTLQHDKPSNSNIDQPKQTKFPLNSSYQLTNYNTNSSWIKNVANNEEAITQMLLEFTRDVYDIQVPDSSITSTVGFQTVLQAIISFNLSLGDSQTIFMPKAFHSEKQVVDLFINEIKN